VPSARWASQPARGTPELSAVETSQTAGRVMARSFSLSAVVFLLFTVRQPDAIALVASFLAGIQPENSSTPWLYALGALSA